MEYKKLIEEKIRLLREDKNLAVRNQNYQEAAFFRDMETRYEKFLKEYKYTKEQYKEMAFEKTLTSFERMDNSTGEKVLFELAEFQIRILKNLVKHKYNIISTPRQMGNSHLMCAYIAALAHSYENSEHVQIFVCGNKMASACRHIKNIVFYLKQLDISFRHSKEQITSEYFTIKAVSRADHFTGFQPDYIFLMDAAYYTDRQNLELRLFTPQADITYVSSSSDTPSKFQELLDNKNNFMKTYLSWYEHPQFNRGLTWSKLNVVGEVITIQEELFTKKSFDEMATEGYVPSSPWFREMLKMGDIDMVLKEILNIQE